MSKLNMSKFSKNKWLTALSQALGPYKRPLLDSNVRFLSTRCFETLKSWRCSDPGNPILSELHLQDAMWMIEKLLKHNLSSSLIEKLAHTTSAADDNSINTAAPAEAGGPCNVKASMWSIIVSEACTRLLALQRDDLINLVNSILSDVADAKVVLDRQERSFLVQEIVRHCSFSRHSIAAGADSALDAVQEALVKVMGTLPYCDVEKVFMAWLDQQQEFAPDIIWPDLRPGFHQWYERLAWTDGFIEACRPA